ncbi:SDR family NAD(P)-dependent oxidoreductase [Nocardia jiangxiensis]|uniref:SDR family NAD(P)-dependent oxidoreductase n=1 Tax=Nocardia jiangxiensis TaxID=282685 RepID=A0ABW6SC68_9NOCA|nr:SDR family oxidoreductase [Nocardia jiangxiensis]
MSLSWDPRPLFDISDRRVVVTGGTRGLGAVIARGLAACGARVAVVGRSCADGCAVVSEIEAAGGEGLAVSASLADPVGPSDLVAEVVQAFGGIDVLVNNAGVAERVAADEVDRDAYRRVHGLNAEAALFLCQAAFPYLSEARGSVVNVLTTGLWTGGAGSVLYRSSKAALWGTTMVLAREWAPHGVRVNAVAPGAFAAGMGERMTRERSLKHIADTPMGRLGDPSELVPAVLYLVSDAASFVTGTVLRVDGGAVSQ